MAESRTGRRRTVREATPIAGPATAALGKFDGLCIKTPLVSTLVDGAWLPHNITTSAEWARRTTRTWGILRDALTLGDGISCCDYGQSCPREPHT